VKGGGNIVCINRSDDRKFTTTPNTTFGFGTKKSASAPRAKQKLKPSVVSGTVTYHTKSIVFFQQVIIYKVNLIYRSIEFIKLKICIDEVSFIDDSDGWGWFVLFYIEQ
jgi:hypothetical protein